MAALVATALLTAQLAGVAHRIEHPLGQFGDIVLADSLWGGATREMHDHASPHDAKAGLQLEADAAHDHDHPSAHDCAAYDAAACATGPPRNPTACLAPIVAARTVALLHLSQPGSAAQLGFRSRAPPHARA